MDTASCQQTSSAVEAGSWLRARSRPRHFSLWLREHDALQEADGFFQSLAARHQAVLMLDRERAVVAAHAQRRDEVAPEPARMSVADRPENPRAIQLLAVMLRVEHAVDARVPFVNAGV